MTTNRGRTRAGRRHRLVLAVLTPAGLALTLVAPAGAGMPGAGRGATLRGAVAEPGAMVGPVAIHVPETQHVVAPGETLSGIAARYGTTVSALAAVNGVADADLVRHGSTLTVAGAPAAPVAAASPSGSFGGLPSRLQGSPRRLSYIPTFDRWAAATGVPADLLKAMTWHESGWQDGVVSSTGAVGVGQLMPDTVDFMEDLIGVDLDPAVVDDNIRMSARYLRWLLDRFGSVEDALAGYYQGPASIERQGPLGETRAYIDVVVALRRRF